MIEFGHNTYKEASMATTTKTTGKVKKPEGTNGLAVTGFVLSLCGFATVITFFVGLILSAMGLSQTKKTGQDGRGLALAGVIIGAIGSGITIIIGIIMTIAIIFAAGNGQFHSNIKDVYEDYEDCSYTYTYNTDTKNYDFEYICD